jgi:hypothetical protein
MRPALLCLLLTALSWPALAQQDQSQTAPTTAPPPSSQAPAQPSTPTGGQQAPATEAPPSSAKTVEKKTAEKNAEQKKTSKKKGRKNHKKAAPKKPPENTADAGPKRIVVRRGGTSDTGGQLEPGVPQTETDHQRQATEQLLESTDASLKNITRRTLTPDQQDMVRQISLYMEQSRSANSEGDLGRARNLAEKAHMLCDALARQ